MRLSGRIHKRGRPDEIEVEREYWDNLNKFYEANYKDFDPERLLVLQVDELDYVHRPKILICMDQIKRAWDRVSQQAI